MNVHGVASLPHYAEHVRSVFDHLPRGLKGALFEGPRTTIPKTIDDDDLVLVAGFYDIDRARGRRVVYIEHGAGQSYYHENGKPHPAYHGSEHPDNVIGYICPRQEVADAWDRPAVAVGSPVCDPFPLVTTNQRPVIVFTFHWDCRLLPETRSALDHYAADLGSVVHSLRARGYEVFGHHHPRDKRAPKIWRHLQVPELSIDEVRQRADVLVVDNSSLAYEMLHLNRAVVSLNAPWYRRDVSHGLRFWDAVPGWSVDGPGDLAKIDWGALVESPVLRPQSMDPAIAAYDQPLSDGGAGVRAAAWVTVLAAQV